MLHVLIARIYMYDIYDCLILLILPNICSFNMELSVNYCDDSFLTLQNLEREQDDGNQGMKYTTVDSFYYVSILKYLHFQLPLSVITL